MPPAIELGQQPESSEAMPFLHPAQGSASGAAGAGFEAESDCLAECGGLHAAAPRSVSAAVASTCHSLRACWRALPGSAPSIERTGWPPERGECAPAD